jgi:hypothetical protein
MKKNAICASEVPGQTAGVKASPQFGICIVDESSSPSPAPADPVPAGATARQTAPGNTLPIAQPDSVVSKVAKILIHQGRNTVWKHSIRQEDGCLHQKVMLSLQAKQLA